MVTKQSNKWSYKKLSEVCDFKGGGTPSKQEPAYWNGNIPWASVKDIKSSSLVSTQDKISKLGLNNSSASLATPGDLILITRISPGKSTISKIEVAINQDLKIVSPKAKISSKFLHYFFQSIERQIQDLSSGTTVLGITLNSLNEIPFPDIPYEKQLSIVSKIEELFSELDKGIESLKLAQQQLKVYRQSVLKWAFEGRLTNENVKEGEIPGGWRMTTITSLIKSEKNALKAGPFGSSLKKEFYVNKGYKIYGQEQVISGNPFFGDYFINEAKYKELETCKVKPNDILISLVGTVGKVLLMPESCQMGIINPRLIKVSLDTSIYLPLFFKYYFESSFVKSFYSSEAKGTTMDVLNLGIIKTIPFPICSTSEQKSIVDEIESRFSVIDKMEESINQSFQQGEVMRQSILKRAFEGNITFF